MDDVPWNNVVHQKSMKTRCFPQFYHWNARGISLHNISISCPDCKEFINMQDVYRIIGNCTGRSPEREGLRSRPERAGCTERFYVIQKQASNLYVGETISALTLPPLDDALSQALLDNVISSMWVASMENVNEFKRLIENLSSRRKISKEYHDLIVNADADTILSTMNYISQLDNEVQVDDKEAFMEMVCQREYETLKKYAVSGYPPGRDFRSGPRLIMDAENNIQTDNYLITPVSLLETITVLSGFKRVVGRNVVGSRIVNIGCEYHNDTWLPGMKKTGEGIFITMKSEDNDIVRNPGLWNMNGVNHHFVWWHSLSHALIRELSYYSGYSLPSISERVYPLGGLLIYSSRPGSDGSMGGFQALLRFIPEIIERTFDRASYCSNDPLCDENGLTQQSQDFINGSACYACMFLPETTCEHRNKYLDRQILINNVIL